MSAGGLHANDAGGHARGAEPVVDIYDACIRGATIEHGEQSGDTAESRAIVNAGGHGDDRRENEPGDDAGQRAFHARHTDNDAC